MAGASRCRKKAANREPPRRGCAPRSSRVADLPTPPHAKWTSLVHPSVPDVSIVNFQEAKTYFSALIEKVGTGEEIVIAKADSPAARLVGHRSPRPPRRLGAMAGRFSVPGELDTMGADTIRRPFERPRV